MNRVGGNFPVGGHGGCLLVGFLLRVDGSVGMNLRDGQHTLAFLVNACETIGPLIESREATCREIQKIVDSCIAHGYGKMTNVLY